MKDLERERQRARAWREANPEKVRELNRKRYAANLESDRLARLEYRTRNHETIIARNRKWREENRDKILAYKRAQRAKDPQKANAAVKDWLAKNPGYRRSRSLKTYGLTIESRDALLLAQGNCCAICKTTDPGKRDWSTDHDHAIGETAVRGIICGRCNAALGFLGDTLDSVERWSAQATAYLRAAAKKVSQ